MACAHVALNRWGDARKLYRIGDPNERIMLVLSAIKGLPERTFGPVPYPRRGHP